MKEEEGARTIACPHKVGSLFLFMKFNQWCSTMRSLKTQLGYMKQENGCSFFRRKYSALLCPTLTLFLVVLPLVHNKLFYFVSSLSWIATVNSLVNYHHL